MAALCPSDKSPGNYTHRSQEASAVGQKDGEKAER